MDGDGWSDPTPYWRPAGGSGDAWPDDPTQWHDADGDGRGDNPRGTTADVCPSVAGTSVGPSAGGDRWGCKDTDGVVGRTSAMPSFTSRRNGEIPTAMVSETVAGHQGDACPEMRGTSLLDGWAAGTPMAMAGLTRPMLGPPIRLAWVTPPPNHCNGWIRMKTGLATFLWVLSETTVQTRQGPLRERSGVPRPKWDGWSNTYGEFAATIAIMGEDPAASWLTYAVITAGFLLGAIAAFFVRAKPSPKRHV